MLYSFKENNLIYTKKALVFFFLSFFCYLQLAAQKNTINTNALRACPITVTTPTGVFICDDKTTINLEGSAIEGIIFTGLIKADYTINYYTTLPDANASINEIPNPTALTITALTTIWARITEVIDPTCFEIISFDIAVKIKPTVLKRNDVTECSEYLLPNNLNPGEEYHLFQNGGGAILTPGVYKVKNKAKTQVFIYKPATATQCDAQSSFFVNLPQYFSFTALALNPCGKFTVPSFPKAAFYTLPGGPAGGGALIPTGTVYTNTSTTTSLVKEIHFYAKDDVGSLCRDKKFTITIKPLPPLDTTYEGNDVYACNPYTLPPLGDGDFYFGANGNNPASAHTNMVTFTRTVWAYAKDPVIKCPKQYSFKVNIAPEFTDITVCDRYTLTKPAFGDFYTAANGGGTKITDTEITTTTTVYYYASEITTTPNCTNDISFIVTITQPPTVDDILDIVDCVDSLRELPTLLEPGSRYFTQSGGLGTELFAGHILDNTYPLIYIYNYDGTCDNETDFTVTINNNPPLDLVVPISNCGNLTLIPPTNGKYFPRSISDASGQGTELTGTDLIITTTQTIFIYNIDTTTGCESEKSFVVTIHPELQLNIPDGIICVNDDGMTTKPLFLESNLDPIDYEVNWFLESVLVGTGDNYNALKSGTYTVEANRRIPISSSCNYNTVDVIVMSSSPKFEVIILTEYFVDSYEVEVNTIQQGLGNYVFSLNSGPYQVSNLFDGISPGNHIITVKDTTAVCNDTILNFTALKYPDFFTPNNDGENETWNIPDLKNDPSAVINIFNRFGRLLATIKPSGIGWNGTSKSILQPSNDYWFEVTYTKDGKTNSYRNHFTLIRK